MFRNILVAIDGSRHADRAFDGRDRPRRLRARRLTLFTAVVPPPTVACFAVGTASTSSPAPPSSTPRRSWACARAFPTTCRSRRC